MSAKTETDATKHSRSEEDELSARDVALLARQRLTEAPKIAQAFSLAIFLGLLVLGGFAFERIVVYWTENESRYFNPQYSEGNNISKVQAHATTGMVTVVVLVPMALSAHGVLPSFFSGAAFQLISFILLVAGTIATIVTVIPLGSFTDLGNLAGNGVVVVAVVWAIMWGVSTLICLILRFCPKFCGCSGHRGRRIGYFRWLVRSSSMAAFGFLLLPIFYSLVDHPAASAATNGVLLGFMVIIAELTARYLFPKEISGSREAATSVPERSDSVAKSDLSSASSEDLPDV